MSKFTSGRGKTTKVGRVNQNRQKCHGHRSVNGNDHNQKAYKMECLNCGAIYGANGSDVWQRKCPDCGGGKPGIPF